MGKSNMFRAETLVLHPITKVPSGATTNFTVDIPAGTYYLALSVKSSVTGTTTTVAVHTFADDAQTKVVDLVFRGMEPDNAAASAVLTLPAGSSGQHFQLSANASANQIPVTIGHGIRVVIVKGGASTDETLEVDVIATRIV